MRRRQGVGGFAVLLCVASLQGCVAGPAAVPASSSELATESRAESEATAPEPAPLARARVHLAAADYRRALEACQEEVRRRPSAAGYVYLTHVYRAIAAYMAHEAGEDRWRSIEQLVRNLSGDRPEVLIDPPDVLPRMAKELIGESVEREADVTAAMAARLDLQTTNRLWAQQQAYQRQHPHDWWLGVPSQWPW